MSRSWKQQFKSALAGMLLGVLVPTLAFGQATLLPNAKQQYLDDAGNSVANGHVDYFIPNTTTKKTIWLDAAKTTPSTNPVILDAAGRPQPSGQTFGDGSYRQRVVDQNNLTVWDAVTTSTGSGGSAVAPAFSEGVMVGTVIAWTNTVLPAKYLYTAGQAVSRTTFSDLLTAITFQTTFLCQVGVATVTVPIAISDSVPIGAPVETSCFAPGTTVFAKSSGSLTMSGNATTTASVTARIFPWGNGDGSTTFNVVDMRGRGLIGRNNMGGSTGTALSSLYYLNGTTQVNPNAIGAVAGNQSNTLLTSNMPGHTHPLVDPGHLHIEQTSAVGGVANNILSGNGSGVNTNSLVSTASATTGITMNSTGGGLAATATVAAGGAGYTAGVQLLTVSGGTCTTQPQFNITTAAGAITAPVLVTAGLCSVVPSNPAATTGGGGAGGTLNVVYSAAPVSIIQPSVTTDYIIKALPDDTPGGPGVSSIQGMTGAIACGLNMTCTANTIAVDLSGLNGLTVLASSTLATAAVLPNTPTYANGAAGVGATLTAGSNTTLTVDGTAAPLNTVVLVKNQASAFQNGIYTVTTAGSGATPWVLTRATYFDQASEMKAGSYTFISGGATNLNTAYALQAAVATVGTDSLTWALFSTGIAGVASLDSAAGVLGVGTGSAKVVSSLLLTNQFASRAYAATLNLSSFSSISTLGYAIPGDGGHAVFRKVGAGVGFIDSFITTFTITGGSGYTNGGPYYGNLFSSGTKSFAIGTVTVAGGAFTAVNIDGTPSNQCVVGDIYSFVGSAAAVGGVNGGMPAGGTGGAITVTGCSTALGSFIDAGGTRWQIVTQPWPNILQFGAKGDWNGTDAGTTDNFNAIQAALWYAGFKTSTSFDSGGFWGGRVDVPQGSYMALGTGLKPIIVPNGVVVWGAHGTASTIKFGTAWDATTYQLTLGDNNWHFACFNSSLYHMELRADSGTQYMTYSNCGQDFAGLYQTYIYSNGASTRPCLHYEKGYGGATVFVIRDVSCSANSNSQMFWLGNTIASGMNLGSTMVEVTNISAGGNSGPSGNHQTVEALLINGGFVNVNRFHFEAAAGGIRVAVGVTGNDETITIQNVNGGGLPVFAPCPGLIILDGINTPGNTVISQVQSSSVCTNVVTNGQAGGVSYNNRIRQPAYFNPNFTTF